MPSSDPGLGILSPQEWDEVSTANAKQDNDWTTAWKTRGRRRRLMSFLRSWIWPRGNHATSEKLRPTAYLDGLRGFAALLVYVHHHQLWVHNMNDLYQNETLENGFGYDNKYHFVALPFVRNFFTGGHYAVTTFYVISGYVLSLKALRLIHKGDHLALGDHLSSAIFRRWLRLFLPIIVFMPIFVTMWHVFPFWMQSPEKQGSWVDEIWSLYVEFKNFSFIYKEGGVPWMRQHFHLWSIPTEFRGSMVIYTYLLALSRSTLKAQLWIQAGLIFYFMYITDGWYCAMFIAGMLICQLNILASEGELPRFLARLAPVKTFIYYHMFALSMYLGGVPSVNHDIEQLSKMRGWHYLSYLKPQAVFDYKWFYLFFAATMLVATVPRIFWLKKFFETRFCQFLGRVSYGLYMVHGPVLWTLGDRLYLLTGWHTKEHLENLPNWVNRIPIPRAGPLGLELSFLIPHIILLPVTLFTADVITRAIDTPSVNFASWFYRKTLGEPPEPKQAKA